MPERPSPDELARHAHGTSAPSQRRPLVGVAVIVVREGRILLGRRRGSHGAETWSLPGGHLEYGEAPEECAHREVLEETGLMVGQLASVGVTNDLFVDDDRHYVTLFYRAQVPDGEPTVREPDKCSEWRWFEPQRLPTPLFLPIRNLLARLGEPRRLLGD